MRRIGIALLAIVGFSNQLMAAPVCERVVISGYANLPPFSVRQGDDLQGLGVDLVSEFFQNLDIPVETQLVDKPVIMEKLLREGKIDVLVASYKTPEKSNDLFFVEPAYYQDTIAVMVPTNKAFDFTDWNTLMGKTGLKLLHTELGAQFSQFADQYLLLDSKPTMNAVFKLLRAEHADYFVGSKTFIDLMLLDNERAQLFTQLKPEIATEPVYIAVSKRSACKDYLPYLKSQVAAKVEAKVTEAMMQRVIHRLAGPQPESSDNPEQEKTAVPPEDSGNQ